MIPSGHEMISRQPEQYQYSYPELQHPSSQGESEIDVMVKDNLHTLKWLFIIADYLLLALIYCDREACLYYDFLNWIQE